MYVRMCIYRHMYMYMAMSILYPSMHLAGPLFSLSLNPNCYRAFKLDFTLDQRFCHSTREMPQLYMSIVS